jgi:hypothetical protein
VFRYVVWTHAPRGDENVNVDRFITIAGLTVSGVWLSVLMLIALLPRF